LCASGQLFFDGVSGRAEEAGPPNAIIAHSQALERCGPIEGAMEVLQRTDGRFGIVCISPDLKSFPVSELFIKNQLMMLSFLWTNAWKRIFKKFMAGFELTESSTLAENASSLIRMLLLRQ
jgi:hypothetical protein